jgi:hypothetical protein
MIGLFGYCNKPLIESLDKLVEKGGKVEMEEKFCSVTLDIIGKSVFNYEFGSVTDESPVVKAVYSALVEAEHRSMVRINGTAVSFFCWCYSDTPYEKHRHPLRTGIFLLPIKLFRDFASSIIT